MLTNTIAGNIQQIRNTLPQGVELVAVSKFQPESAVMEAYGVGQRLFGESRPQELAAKWAALPRDIAWHMIGHLQTNKVRLIAPFVAMVESVDSLRLARVISDEAIRAGRVIDILLEVHVAREESKFGWNPATLENTLSAGEFDNLLGVRIRGVMGMASFTDDTNIIDGEFTKLKSIFDTIKQQYVPQIDVLSMGMSSDYPQAIVHGSTQVRIGSTIFGQR